MGVEGGGLGLTGIGRGWERPKGAGLIINWKLEKAMEFEFINYFLCIFVA